MSATTTAPPQPTFLSVDQFDAEGMRRFGDNRDSWRFECPVCHHVHCIAEYVAAGGSADDAPRFCIGKVNGKGRRIFADRLPSPEFIGCDYGADDLFPSGFYVTRNGIPIPVLPFAPAGEGGQMRNAPLVLDHWELFNELTQEHERDKDGIIKFKSEAEAWEYACEICAGETADDEFTPIPVYRSLGKEGSADAT